MQKIKKGFTLAEILIALAIIGVVLALTVISFKNKQSNDDYIIKIRKIQTNFQNVTDEIVSMDGKVLFLWGWQGDGNSEAADEILRNLIGKKMSYIKYCGTKSGKGCGTSYSSIDGGKLGSWDKDGTIAKAVMKDGTLIGLRTRSECSQDMNNTVLCGELIFDVNGHTGPNRVGRDIYFLGFYSNGLVRPIDYDKSPEVINNNCKKNAGANGKSCAAKIFHDGGVYKKTGSDKYPW